ncbi:MAG: hypothetical protein KDD62_01190 [Bdellovibrionales bacterium]|nr:hypothetical protein [Bdellovibrionales bacterium]
MLFVKFSERALCATWFGGLALALAFPWSVARFLSIKEWSVGYAAFAMYLEAVLPAIIAAFFGARFGSRICRQESSLSDFGFCALGVKISIATAVAWLIVGFLSIVVCGLFFDTSRFAGGIFVLVLFGFPVYGAIAGFGGLALRRLVMRQGMIKGGSGQKNAK